MNIPDYMKSLLPWLEGGILKLTLLGSFQCPTRHCGVIGNQTLSVVREAQLVQVNATHKLLRTAQVTSVV